MDGQKEKEKDEESPRSQKNTNTSPARRSPTITSSGRTTRILPTPRGGMCTPAFASTPPLLPIPIPARATRAVGSKRCSGGCAGENVGADAGEGVKAGAAGLSFVLAQRAVGVVKGASAEDPVPVPLPVSVAALDGLGRCHRKAAEILRVILPQVHADGLRCTTANIVSATAT